MGFSVIFLSVAILMISFIVGKLQNRIGEIEDDMYVLTELVSKLIEDEERDGQDAE